MLEDNLKQLFFFVTDAGLGRIQGLTAVQGAAKQVLGVGPNAASVVTGERQACSPSGTLHRRWQKAGPLSCASRPETKDMSRM